MTLVGYGSYDTESYKPRGTEIFDEHFETLYPLLKVPLNMKNPTPPPVLELNYESMKKGTGGFGTWAHSVTGFPKSMMTQIRHGINIGNWSSGLPANRVQLPSHWILTTSTRSSGG